VSKHPKRAKKAKKAQKRLKTIVNKMLRELAGKMTSLQREAYKNDMELCRHAVNQQRTDTNKVYSLHKPFTKCISKGNAHNQYEFGKKVELIKGGKKGKQVILAVKAFYHFFTF
jgi:IS5 family transposase